MLRDRTAELAFDTITDECVEQLMDGSGIIVVKNSLSPETVTGVAMAYQAARRRLLHRRLASRALAEVGFGASTVYEKVRARDVTVNPYQLPKHMKTAQSALDTLLDLHRQLIAHPKLTSVYDGALDQNLALFALSRGSQAFPIHQDSQGTAGIAEAAQFQPTLWTIYQLNSYNLALPDYSFRTDIGDTVVIAERIGPPPPRPLVSRTGEHTFIEDGSVIHSGINLSNEARYGLGLFNEQVKEM